MKATILPPAERELEEIVAFYDARSATAGDEFLTGYLDGLARFVALPTAWPIASPRNARAYRLNRFPYRIVYQVLEDRDEVLVVAVAHTARRPRYWRDRLV